MPELNNNEIAERQSKIGALLLRNWDPIGVDRREGQFSLKWAVGFWVFLGITYSPAFKNSYIYFLISFFAWWGVSLPFAMYGLRKGDVYNRFCAGISVVIFVVCMYLLMRYGGKSD